MLVSLEQRVRVDGVGVAALVYSGYVVIQNIKRQFSSNSLPTFGLGGHSEN